MGDIAGYEFDPSRICDGCGELLIDCSCDLELADNSKATEIEEDDE